MVGFPTLFASLREILRFVDFCARAGLFSQCLFCWAKGSLGGTGGSVCTRIRNKHCLTGLYNENKHACAVCWNKRSQYRELRPNQVGFKTQDFLHCVPFLGLLPIFSWLLDELYPLWRSHRALVEKVVVLDCAVRYKAK